MAMFLIVGCQSTQSAETETKLKVVKPEVVKEVKKELPKEKEADKSADDSMLYNPFAGVEIPPGQVVTSNKPVICGRLDVMLSRMEARFGEVPIMIGKVDTEVVGKGTIQVMSTLTYNPKTGSYSFLEQMPAEERLLCILSTGKGTVNIESLNRGTSS